MPTSEAKIKANQANAAKSTGPKTPEGKAASCRNALKHGLTGAGVVLPETDAREVKLRAAAYAEELGAEGEVGEALALRMALNSVRMERAADQQTVALSQRIRQIEADFVAPEGSTPEDAAKLRSEATRVAMLDTSKEGTLARKYENAAERAFFRCLKELRERDRVQRKASAATEKADIDAMMASILQGPAMDDEFDALYPEIGAGLPKLPVGPPIRPSVGGSEPVPMTITRPR